MSEPLASPHRHSFPPANHAGETKGSREQELAAPRDEIEQLRAMLSAAETRERALSHELQHRVRNMLAVIRTIYRRSRESGASHAEFAEHFEGRLQALARYQAHVDEIGASIELEDIVRNELLVTHALDRPECSIEGPPVALRHKIAELMGLAVHELATNAIKFGALAQGGHLQVAWVVRSDAAERWLEFSWIETGVSVTSTAPRPSGFGRLLIEEALPYQLGAHTSFELKPGGIECRIRLPLPPESKCSPVEEDNPDDVPLLPSETE